MKASPCRNFKASRHEEEDPVQARSISSPWTSDVVRLTWVTVESKMTARLLHSTNKQEENKKSRGQYKTRVLSRYHRPTQNRNQYILSNIINQLWYSTCSNNKYYIINNYHQVHTCSNNKYYTILIWELCSLVWVY